MRQHVREEIYDLVRSKLISKIINYSPESEHKPFFTSIFSDARIVSASLVHSFYTSFGMSLYEQIALIIARGAGYRAERQYILKGDIDLRTSQLIDEMWEHAKSEGSYSKLYEIEKIRNSIYPARDIQQHSDSIIDVFLEIPSDPHPIEYYIDVKTVKPNKENFQSFKRKLLRWIGYRLSVERGANVHSCIAIPYNPYHPNPYLQSMRGGVGKSLDGEYDILVQDGFWNLVGGNETTYIELLGIFEDVGREISQLIDERFGR